MDGIVGKTYQTYISLSPCQEIDISCDKLSQNDNFVRSPASWNSVSGTMWLRFFQPTPILDLGPQSSWASTCWTGRGRSWITGLAGISGLGPNSEPCGNNRSFPETRERDRVPVKKIGSRDSIFGLVNSTYSFEITNHNQHASNIKYLANLIKKYWTYFRYQKLADFVVCFPPSVRVRAGPVAAILENLLEDPT